MDGNDERKEWRKEKMEEEWKEGMYGWIDGSKAEKWNEGRMGMEEGRSDGKKKNVNN